MTGVQTCALPIYFLSPVAVQVEPDDGAVWVLDALGDRLERWSLARDAKDPVQFDVFMPRLSAGLSLGVASLFTGCHTAEPKLTRASAFRFYREYPRLTREPREVDSKLFLLCSSAAPTTSIETPVGEWVPQYGPGAANGPHAGARVHIYANPIAVKSMSGQMAVFPPDSVVVKEKLNAAGEVLAVGGMIKRPVGRYPEAGD